MKFIPPVVSEKEAKKTLSKKGFLSRLFTGKIKISRLELLNIPQYSFEMIISTRKGKQKINVSVDGVKGTFAFFSLDGITLKEKGKPSCDFIVSPEKAKNIAKDKYSEAIIQSGLMVKSTAEIEELKDPVKLYYPYWVGYYKKGAFYDFAAVDAINGEKTGIRFTPVLMELIRREKQ